MIAFAGNPLDRAEAKRADNAWLAAQWQRQDAEVFAFIDLDPILANGRLARLPPGGVSPLADPVFLGLENGAPRFAAAVALAEGRGEAVEMRRAAMLLPGPEAALAGHGRSLLSWHQTHQYCSRCGAPTVMARGGAQRVCTAPACQGEHFPRVDPVVIMLVIRGDYCLMGRQSRFPPGMYSALAGFVEPGESVEDAVAREVWEEAGVVVDDVCYVMSQPWPFPSSLMLGCLARTAAVDLNRDTEELEDLRWFTRDQVAAALKGETADFFVPPPLAIAHQLLKVWVTG